MIPETILRKKLQRASIYDAAMTAFHEEAKKSTPRFEDAAQLVLNSDRCRGLKEAHLAAVKRSLANLVFAANTVRKVSLYAAADPSFVKNLYFSFYGRRPANVGLRLNKSNVFNLEFQVPDSEFNIIEKRPGVAAFAGVDVQPASLFRDRNLSKAISRFRAEFETLFGVKTEYLGGLSAVSRSGVDVKSHESVHVIKEVAAAHAPRKSRRPKSGSGFRGSLSILDARRARVDSTSSLTLGPFSSVNTEFSAFWSANASPESLADSLLHPLYHVLHPVKLAQLHRLVADLDNAGKRSFFEKAAFRSRVGDLLAESGNEYGFQLPYSEEMRSGSITAPQLSDLRLKTWSLAEKEKAPLKEGLVARLREIQTLQRQACRSDYFIQSLLRGPYAPPTGLNSAIRRNELMLKHLDGVIAALKLDLRGLPTV